MAKTAEKIVEPLKLPPQSQVAEQSLLGGLLIDNHAWDEIAEIVRAEDFYHPRHQIIFRAIHDLRATSDPADIVTVNDRLEATGELETIGGIAYLSALANDTPSTANILTYAEIVHDKANLRRLIDASNSIIQLAYETEGRTQREIMDLAEQAVFAISQQENRGRLSFPVFTNLITSAINRVEELSRLDDHITGMPTGFADLDNMTAGLQASDLVVVAGRPSMGKTSLAMNFAEYAAIQKGKAVAIFSMEMSAEQLALRMLASLGHINAQKVRTGRLSDDDWPRLTSAMELLHDKPFFIDDTPGLTPLELRSRARNLARSDEGQNLGLIVVDYLQLMQGAENIENRATEISNITRALKNLAKELNVPVVVLSQLNRSLEQRPNKRPVMSDLRESGAIEQDADLILFIYRDEVYNPDSPEKGMSEIIIGKQRNGPIGTVTLSFLGEYTRFENYTSQSLDGFYP